MSLGLLGNNTSNTPQIQDGSFMIPLVWNAILLMKKWQSWIKLYVQKLMLDLRRNM